MVNLYLHGSSLIGNTVLKTNQMKWNASQTWLSALELANGEYSFDGKQEDDYLVVDLSYTANSIIVKKEDKIYTANQGNYDRGVILKEEPKINILWNGVQSEIAVFEKYIAWVQKYFDKDHIILVRTICPDRCLTRSFVSAYHPEGKECFNKNIQELEELFIKKADPVVIDIAREYYVNTCVQNYGAYVSYEERFFWNIKEILEQIVLKKKEQRIYDMSAYRFVLERYIYYYNPAYERDEQYLLLERSTPLNIAARAMNRKWLERYKYSLDTIARLKPESFQEILEKYDFYCFPVLEKFIRLVWDVSECRCPEDWSILDELWGTRTGIEVDMQTMLRKYYREEEDLPSYMLPRDFVKEFYMAMIYAKQQEYRKAIAYINQVIKKRNKKNKKYRTRKNTKEQFSMALQYYQTLCEPVAVDIWGSFSTSKILYKEDGCYRVGECILNKSCIRPEEYREAKEKLQESPAKWLLFDIFSVLNEYPLKDEATDREIKAKLDTFIQMLKECYGNHLLFHKWTFRTKYKDEAEDTWVKFSNADVLRDKGNMLECYQSYLEESVDYVIDVAADCKLSADSIIIIDGINYEWAYYEKASRRLEEVIFGTEDKDKRKE